MKVRNRLRENATHYTERPRRQRHPTPVLLPGGSHGQRSLVGCSPWGHKESGTISLSLSKLGSYPSIETRRQGLYLSWWLHFNGLPWWLWWRLCLQSRDMGSIPGSEKSPGGVFLPAEFHGQRNLAGYSPWGHKELYTTEWLILSPGL